MNSSPRAPRADAARNRQAILDAARLAFDEDGANVSMAEVVRRSGVGSATVYRNFPHRPALLEALYVGEVDDMCAATVDGATARERLLAWLHRFFDFVVGKHGLALELLQYVDETSPVFGASRARVTSAGRPLLVAAQDAGEVDRDLELDQLLDLIVAVAEIRREPAYVRSVLDVALAGLTRP